MIRFIPMLITNEYKVLKSAESRGIDYKYSNMLSRIFTRKLIFRSVFGITRRTIKDIKKEGNLKLYSHKRYRTNYKVNKFGIYDLIYLLVSLSLIIYYLYERGILNEILTKF